MNKINMAFAGSILLILLGAIGMNMQIMRDAKTIERLTNAHAEGISNSVRREGVFNFVGPDRNDYERQRSRKMSDMKEPRGPSMTIFGVWAKETNCETQGILLWPATNLTFAFTHKPTPAVFTNGVWIIRFEP